jgi:TPR repeat protein
MWRTVRILVMAIAVAFTGCTESTLVPQPDVRSAPEEEPAAARPALEDVLAVAWSGDARTVLLAYQQATTDAERRKLICIAANRDLPEAQTKIARLHWWSPGDPPTPFAQDGFKYCVWSVIAAHRHQPVDDLEGKLRQFFPNIEYWRVSALANAWRPDPSKCENINDSEYFSIPQVAQPAPALEDVLAAARAGDGKAAFLAYRQATTDAERRKWICIAANKGRTEAQAEIARLHSRSPGDPPGPFAHDLYKAYIWSIIAVHRRLPLDEIEQQLGWMVTEGKWRARALAVSWRPDPSQCENMEDSEYFSISPVTEAKESF